MLRGWSVTEQIKLAISFTNNQLQKWVMTSEIGGTLPLRMQAYV